MAKVYLVNKDTGRRFQVIKVDKARNEITLKGEMCQWCEPYDKEELQRMGYEVVREEAEEEEDA